MREIVALPGSRSLMSFLKTAKLLVRKTEFLLWKRKNPSAAFTDYFLKIVYGDLARGLSHPTLGPKLCKGSFGISGQKTFQTLARRYGVGPGDTCVDYGCGTLRVGVHAIKYLRRDRYWGMDISAPFLAQGLELIGRDLARTKRPNLRVISPESIAEVAAAKPKLVFSVNVLLHVHPAELSEYANNILALIGNTGAAVIAGEWNESRTIQIARQSWIHSEVSLREATEAAGGSATFIQRAARDDRINGLIEIRNSRRLT
jgi:hypothetical protein